MKLQFAAGQEVPSTRWGHSASVLDDKLYILGGRNELDVSDLYCFDMASSTWSKLESQQAPKPRRRHSSVFISTTLVMFGGFDGEFYNDLHVFHTKPRSDKVSVADSTLTLVFNKLVGTPQHANMVFKLESTLIPAN